MSIQSEDRINTLKERFKKNGFDGFSACEAVELVLAFGNERDNAPRVAKPLIDAFGGLRGVLDASPEEMAEAGHISKGAVTFIRFIKEAAGEYLRLSMIGKNAVHLGRREVLDYLEFTLSGERIEKFLAVYLDSGGFVITVETLFEGTINQTAVYPRRAVEMAFKHGAASLIVAHNHPSGDSQPSESDRLLTQGLVLAGRAVDLEVIDHVIIGKGNRFSAKEAGWLDNL